MNEPWNGKFEDEFDYVELLRNFCKAVKWTMVEKIRAADCVFLWELGIRADEDLWQPANMVPVISSDSWR